MRRTTLPQARQLLLNYRDVDGWAELGDKLEELFVFAFSDDNGRRSYQRSKEEQARQKARAKAGKAPLPKPDTDHLTPMDRKKSARSGGVLISPEDMAELTAQLKQAHEARQKQNG